MKLLIKILFTSIFFLTALAMTVSGWEQPPNQAYAQDAYVVTPVPTTSFADVEEAEDLFSEATKTLPFVDQNEPTTLRSRQVMIKPPQLQNVTNLNLNLFADVQLEAVQRRVEYGFQGSMIWIGDIKNDPYGTVTLVHTNDVLIGTVSTATAHYHIGYIDDGIHVVTRVDPQAFPYLQDDALPVPDDVKEAIEEQPQRPLTDDGSIIDLMVNYTPAARQAAGGTSAMIGLINLAVSEMNQGLNQSQINFSMRLVHVAEINYAETGNYLTDLDRYTNKNDGYMDTIHVWRDQYRADVSTLIVNSMSGACGVGWLTGPNTNYESNAFNLVLRTCAVGPQYTFAHELGHNMGSHHDRSNATSQGAYSYSCGYQAPNRAFRTIMAYNCSAGNCPRVNFWSNPNLSYGGQAMGRPASASDSADNRLSLNDMAIYVANFRQEETTIPECENVTEIPTSECEALVAIYESTGGENWHRNDNWLQTNNPCSWQHVACAENGHVGALYLGGNNLTGAVPEEIGDFPYLWILDLFSNEITSLPSTIGNLNNVGILNIEYTPLSTIPAEIWSLTSLNDLRIGGGSIGFIPPEISNLVNLHVFHFTNAGLTEIPAEVGYLPSLDVSLSLCGNQLSDLPASFANLNQLQGIGLCNNQFSVIPPEIFSMINLRWALNLSDNQITTVSPAIANLTNLTGDPEYIYNSGMDLSGNRIQTLPAEISNLTNLTRLHIGGNELAELPSVIGQLTSLQHLTVDNNPLAGELPEFLLSLDLSVFYFYNSALCVPEGNLFQNWLNGIDNVWGTGVSCQTALISIQPPATQPMLGRPFCLPITIEDVEEGLGGFELAAQFPTQRLEATSLTNGAFLGRTGRTPITIENQIDNTSGTLLLAMASSGTAAGTTENGILAQMCFEPQTSGTVTIDLTNSSLATVLGETLSSRTQGVQFEISNCYWADFDCDNDVDISDIQRVVGRWGISVGHANYDLRYDFDEDGDIDYLDVQRVAAEWGWPNLSRGGGGGGGSSQGGVALSTTPATVQVELGQRTTIALALSAGQDIAGFETTLTYDPAVLQVDDIMLTDHLASTGRTQVMLGPTIDNTAGTAKFGAVTFGNEAGVNAGGEVAIITVTALSDGAFDLALLDSQVGNTNGDPQTIAGENGSQVMVGSVSAEPTIYLPVISR